ncbi:MAG: cytochrome c [Bacteroidia bacterium]|nr:cytochrome c [Bacteroidia bacterium]
MRTDLELIEQIEKYLLGKMTEAEKKSFDEEIKKDNSLKEKVEAQKKIMEAVKQNALKTAVKKGYKNKVVKNKIFKGGTTLVITTLAVISVMMFIGKKKTSNILYELNEKGQKTWAMADKNLSPQLFKIDNTRDTVIETEGGMVLAIPSGCFKDKQNATLKEPVDPEIKEAFTPETILTSGLSTMSGDRMLETGGMFYLSARNGSDPLQIDATKPINANVPAAEKKPGMMLFTGERRADGTIDWIAPKELPKDLLPVEITSLNFYPPNYEDSLEGMGYDRHNKKFTDSLYYSFAGLFGDKPIVAMPTAFSISKGSKVDTTKLAPSFSDTLLVDPVYGRKVFKANCATCHKMSQKLTGPALEGCVNRAPSKEWVAKFIRSSSSLIKSGDPYAKSLVADNGGSNGMSEFGFLSGEDMSALITFLMVGRDDDQQVCYDSTLPIIGINPTKIQSIWNEKFNKTILATKEFEERLKVIHKTYNENVLMLYVNNIGKPMWQIDSMAAQITGGEQREKFIQFMNRREGGVKTKSGLQEKLSKYFEEKQKAYTEAASKTYKKFYEENVAAKNKFENESEQAKEEREVNEKENYQKELEVNLDEAYRQLGYKTGGALPTGNYYSVDVTISGWENVDVYVKESTSSRTTLNYTSAISGKKAIIKYEPITVNISNDIKFDNTFAYLLADSLPSYMMMKNENGTFKEDLNELFKYDLVVVGLKGNDKYIFTEQNIQPNSVKRVDLQKVADSKFSSLIKKLNRPSPSEKMEKEIEFRIKEKNEIVRKQKVAKTEELRERIIPIIFLVGNGPQPVVLAKPQNVGAYSE